MKPNHLITVFSLLILTGCSESLLKYTSTPGYADGYKEGCQNGTEAASNLTGQKVRNNKRYYSEPEYAKGWQAGNRECNGSNFRQNPNNPMQPIDLNGPSTVNHEDW
jgi:hypothetical protein